MRNGVAGFIGAFFFGLLFAAVGAFVGFYFGKPLIDNAKASESWPTVQGRVTESRLESERDDGSTTYSAHVVYEYTVKNEKLDSDRIWFGGDYSTSNRTGMQKIVRDYPVGKQVTVYYSPDDPVEAVLMPGAYFSTYVIFIVGMVFLAIGSVVMLVPVGKLVMSIVGGSGAGTAEADALFTSEQSGNDGFDDLNDNDWQDRFSPDGR